MTGYNINGNEYIWSNQDKNYINLTLNKSLEKKDITYKELLEYGVGNNDKFSKENLGNPYLLKELNEIISVFGQSDSIETYNPESIYKILENNELISFIVDDFVIDVKNEFKDVEWEDYMTDISFIEKDTFKFYLNDHGFIEDNKGNIKVEFNSQDVFMSNEELLEFFTEDELQNIEESPLEEVIIEKNREEELNNNLNFN